MDDRQLPEESGSSMDSTAVADAPWSVALLDDDPFEHTIFRSVCARAPAPIELRSAHTVEELIEQILESHTPDILFCDNHVPPHMSYEESVPLIRQSGYAGPIIVTSSYVGIEESRAPLIGVSALMDKSAICSNSVLRALARHAPRGPTRRSGAA